MNLNELKTYKWAPRSHTAPLTVKKKAWQLRNKYFWGLIADRNLTPFHACDNEQLELRNISSIPKAAITVVPNDVTLLIYAQLIKCSWNANWHPCSFASVWLFPSLWSEADPEAARKADAAEAQSDPQGKEQEHTEVHFKKQKIKHIQCCAESRPLHCVYSPLCST